MEALCIKCAEKLPVVQLSAEARILTNPMTAGKIPGMLMSVAQARGVIHPSLVANAFLQGGC